MDNILLQKRKPLPSEVVKRLRGVDIHLCLVGREVRALTEFLTYSFYFLFVMDKR